jgi:hypothetical protein
MLITNNKVEKDKYNKTSVESLVLGILAVLSSFLFFILLPNKPFGINIIGPMDAIEQFSKFTFLLFLVWLLCIFAIGLSIVAIVFGIMDFKGIFRGLHVIGKKAIYLVGVILGFMSILFITGFLLSLNFIK